MLIPSHGNNVPQGKSPLQTFGSNGHLLLYGSLPVDPDEIERPPMNILIFPFGSAGDVFPLIGLAQALQARGHRSTIAIHGHFREAVLNAGINSTRGW